MMKNNRQVCALVSPGQYKSLIEMLSNYLLLAEAECRMAANQDTENISHEDMMRNLGITREELDAVDVEIAE